MQLQFPGSDLEHRAQLLLAQLQAKLHKEPESESEESWGKESTLEHMRKVWAGPTWMRLLHALCQEQEEPWSPQVEELSELWS